MRLMALPLMILMISSLSMCKSAEWTPVAGGQLTIQASRYSPFPHPKRAEGHNYNDSLYSFVEHYNDSSVAIFVPDLFKKTETVDLVFYFHGWGNSIHKSLEKFDLLQQFSNSKSNAVFVFPQGPRDAPDSFGGRLEEKDVFKDLVMDVLTFLKDEKRIDTVVPGRIILAGHSGAYRVISFILNRGGLTENISEVYLFNVLYAQVENYTYWLEKYGGKLINITTPNGGTASNSADLVNDLNDWGVLNQRIDGNMVTVDDLKASRITTMFTSLGHSEVINPYFAKCLSASDLDKGMSLE